MEYSFRAQLIKVNTTPFRLRNTVVSAYYDHG